MQTMYELLGIHKKVDKEKQNVENSKNNNQSVLKGRFKIQKSEDDKHLAFGWASISIDEAGEQLVDWQEDMIDPEELENAAYDFVRLYREGGEMHERGDCAILVESVVSQKKKWKPWAFLLGLFLWDGGLVFLSQMKMCGRRSRMELTLCSQLKERQKEWR